MNGNYDKDIVDLTTAQKVTNEHLDQIDETLDALDRTIRGDYEKDRDGLVARFKDMELSINKINAVLFVDSTGKKGLVSEVAEFKTGILDRRERRKERIYLIGLIVSGIFLVLSNLDRIGKFWNDTFGKQKPSHTSRKSKRPAEPLESVSQD